MTTKAAFNAEDWSALTNAKAVFGRTTVPLNRSGAPGRPPGDPLVGVPVRGTTRVANR